MSVKQIAEYLGHEKVSTTLDIYTHIDFEGKKVDTGKDTNHSNQNKDSSGYDNGGRWLFRDGVWPARPRRASAKWARIISFP